MSDKLKEVLSIQSVSYDQFRMFAYIVRQVKQIPDTIMFIDDGNLYITKGYAPTYPCMVAHMDTVHDITDDLYPLEFNGMITGFTENYVKVKIPFDPAFSNTFQTVRLTEIDRDGLMKCEIIC